jgi:hypothetical protein
MNNETCPHCGGGRNFVGENYYDCGSDRKKSRTPECYERQLAAKDEEIDILNTKIALLEDEVKRLRGEVK